MSRLTYELGHKGSGSYEPIQNKDMPVNNYIACVNKLGHLEDLLEKYGIPNLEYLEKCIIDHDKYGELGEKIGCPLEALAKLMLNGFYYEYPEYDDNDEPTGKMEMVYDSCTGITYLVMGCDKNIYIDVRNLEEPLKLSDYGKTFWLRMDKSE